MCFYCDLRNRAGGGGGEQKNQPPRFDPKKGCYRFASWGAEGGGEHPWVLLCPDVPKEGVWEVWVLKILPEPNFPQIEDAGG